MCKSKQIVWSFFKIFFHRPICHWKDLAELKARHVCLTENIIGQNFLLGQFLTIWREKSREAKPLRNIWSKFQPLAGGECWWAVTQMAQVFGTQCRAVQNNRPDLQKRRKTFECNGIHCDLVQLNLIALKRVHWWETAIVFLGAVLRCRK